LSDITQGENNMISSYAVSRLFFEIGVRLREK